MLVFGTRNIVRREQTGHFVCPRCRTSEKYTVCRTYNHFHIYFVPLSRGQVVAEAVQCDHCATAYPLSVLAADAPTISSALDAGQPGDISVSESLGNVVTLTSAAALEIERRHQAGCFDSDAVVRIKPPQSLEGGYTVAFDYALADGRDWIGQSHGVPIVVDRRDAPLLLGRKIDFRNGQFLDAGTRPEHQT